MQTTSCKVNKFGEKLGYMLSVKGWSQQQLADKLHTSQQCISRWINGNREPSLDDVLLICRIFDEDPNEMLGFNDLSGEELDNYFKRKR